MTEIPEIDVHELASRLQRKEPFILLDVREAWELDYALIDDSRLKVVPMSRLAQFGEEALPEEIRKKDVEILVLCHHGVRSAKAAQWLLQGGWINVYSVRGGIADYASQIDASIGKY